MCPFSWRLATQANRELHNFSDALKDLHALIRIHSQGGKKPPKKVVTAAKRVRDSLRRLKHDKGAAMAELLHQLHPPSPAQSTDAHGQQGAPSQVPTAGRHNSPSSVLRVLERRVHDVEHLPFFVDGGGIGMVWPEFAHHPAAIAIMTHLCAHVDTLRQVVAVLDVSLVVALITDPPTDSAEHDALDVACAALGLLSAYASRKHAFGLAGADSALSACNTAASNILLDTTTSPPRLLVIALQAVLRCCVDTASAVAAMRGSLARAVLHSASVDDPEVEEAASLTLARIFGHYTSQDLLAEHALRLLRDCVCSSSTSNQLRGLIGLKVRLALCGLFSRLGLRGAVA